MECIPCFLRQALRAGRQIGADDKAIKELLDELGSSIKDIDLESTPPGTGAHIYKRISEITGNKDPFLEVKNKHIKEALHLMPMLRDILDSSEDRLEAAIRLAIAGNVIDLGVDREINILEDVLQVMKQDFAVFDYDAFKKRLSSVKEILYLGDNAGESVFDRLLIEELGKPVTYVVRGVPIINDVTYQEAVNSGLDEVAGIISSGTTAPGTVLEFCNEDFLERFRNAEMIISKGQGNFEALSSASEPIFFLLMAKCPVIAEHIGVNVEDIILSGI